MRKDVRPEENASADRSDVATRSPSISGSGGGNRFFGSGPTDWRYLAHLGGLARLSCPGEHEETWEPDICQKSPGYLPLLTG
jgi:heat shock protein HslJ